MAAEPINIFSHKVDPEGVLECLRKLAPDLKVKGEGGDWSTIVISEKRGLLRKPFTITFNHARDYYAGPDFANQMRGMQGYFSRFPQNELTPRIMLLIASFKFAISLFPVPEPDLYLESDDERLKYVFAVVRHLDGAIFTPSGLRDAAGRFLCGGRDADPEAVMPQIYMRAPQPSEMPLYMGGTAPNPAGPPADRVARRALCLAAVSWRGMLEREQDDPAKLEEARKRFLEWIESAGIGPELEADEWSQLQRPVGKGDPSQFTRAEWHIEGSAMLAWAVKQYDLPSYDAQADVASLGRVIGMQKPEEARAFVGKSELRPQAEIERVSKQLLAIHWRLREQRLRPGRRDFEHDSQDAWFGKMPFEGLRFVNGDLAIGDCALSEAPDQILIPFTLAIQERHRAINWVCGDDPVYSRTDTPT
jgi:hypothetical protein